jgi:hypothetical protein
VSRTREEAEKAGRATNTAQVPYPPDVFPGARDVETPYGTIKVFEWGPEEGEKVALLHGIGTPCIAMGDMASEFVRRGCRVILFGEWFLSVPTVWGGPMVEQQLDRFSMTAGLTLLRSLRQRIL